MFIVILQFDNLMVNQSNHFTFNYFNFISSLKIIIVLKVKLIKFLKFDDDCLESCTEFYVNRIINTKLCLCKQQ